MRFPTTMNVGQSQLQLTRITITVVLCFCSMIVVSGASSSSPSEFPPSVAAAPPTISATTTNTHRLRHFLGISIPAYGHVMPLKGIAEALLDRGHNVTLILEEGKDSWCTTYKNTSTPSNTPTPTSTLSTIPSGEEAPSHSNELRCVYIPKVNRLLPEFFAEMSEDPVIANTYIRTIFELIELFRESIKDVLRVSGARRHRHQPTPTTSSLSSVVADALKKDSNVDDDDDAPNMGHIDALLVDSSTFSGFALANELGIPAFNVLPLALRTSANAATYLPPLGSAYPTGKFLALYERVILWLTRLIVYWVGHTIIGGPLNDILMENNITAAPSVDHAVGQMGLILSVTTFGFDVSFPSCPSLVPLGSLVPSVKDVPLEPALAHFLGHTCADRKAIYINFGTLATQNNETFAKLVNATLMSDFCVIWKVRELHRLQYLSGLLETPVDDENGRVDANNKVNKTTKKAKIAAVLTKAHRYTINSVVTENENVGDDQRVGRDVANRFYISNHFNSPLNILQHVNTHVFVSHCGDTSVLESIQAETPIAGIPYFADQADVCHRLSETEVGMYVGHKHHFKPEDLLNALNALGKSSSPRRAAALRKLKHTNRFSRTMGGAARAARVIESVMDNDVVGITGWVGPSTQQSTSPSNTPSVGVSNSDTSGVPPTPHHRSNDLRYAPKEEVEHKIEFPFACRVTHDDIARNEPSLRRPLPVPGDRLQNDVDRVDVEVSSPKISGAPWLPQHIKHKFIYSLNVDVAIVVISINVWMLFVCKRLFIRIFYSTQQ